MKKDFYEIVPSVSKDTSVVKKAPSGVFLTYMKDICRYDLLSREEEVSLLKEFQDTGDIEIAKKLVVHNLRLVVKIALQYKSSWKNIMDLIQEGNIGLMQAVSRYDGKKGTRLSTYASWWIRSYVLKFILTNFRLVKIGTTNEQKKLFYNLVREKDRLLALGIDPSYDKIADNLGVSEKAVISMDKRLNPSTGGEISLDAPLDDGGSGTMVDVLPELTEDSLENSIAMSQALEILKDNLTDFLETLKERDRDIFKKRLLSELPPSLQKIADEYGVSRERIRQIEERLIKNLKVYMSKHIR